MPASAIQLRGGAFTEHESRQMRRPGGMEFILLSDGSLVFSLVFVLSGLDLIYSLVLSCLIFSLCRGFGPGVRESASGRSGLEVGDKRSAYRRATRVQG